MTPRTRVRTVSAAAPVATVIEATRDTGHSRFPVIGDSVDDIRGLVHVKQAVAVPVLDRGITRVREVMVAGACAALGSLDRLLHLLQQRGLQLAVVVDEYGGTAGIVTFEDLVEELVGDVVDEHDSPAPGVRRQPDGTWLLSGLLRPDEIQAAIGSSCLPDVPTTRRSPGSFCRCCAESRILGIRSTCPAPRSP